MSSLAVEPKPLARQVNVTDDELTVVLADGRRISAPLAWFPRLLRATPEQRRQVMDALAEGSFKQDACRIVSNPGKVLLWLPLSTGQGIPSSSAVD